MIKKLTGIVVSNKMDKAVVVKIERKLRHPIYQKVVTTHKRIKARNEISEVNLGDVVVIEETRPLSKEIRFKVVSKIEVVESK